MPDERHFDLDLTYPEWHRVASTSRFLSLPEAESLWFIDVDFVEACRRCSRPLLLIEHARDVGQKIKPHSITLELAKLADVPAAVVFYKCAPTRQPHVDLPDIASFRVRRVWPEPVIEHSYTPAQWANLLLRLRRQHETTEHLRRAA